MPSEIGLPFVLIMYIVIGGSILGAFGLRTTRTITSILALFAGMFVHSVLFFACDLMRVGMTATTMFVSLLVGVAATTPLWKTTRSLLHHLRTAQKNRIGLYDVPVIGFSAYVFYMILWASWYWPVTPFDAMAGIDLVAKYAVEDHSIINRVFTHPSLQGQLSNQPFYAPFAMLMQVIMKLLGFTHNQVWVGIVSVSFSVFIWAALRQLVHPAVASVLYLVFLLTPEMFGYTYLLQTDYINAVFMVAAVYLFWQGAEHNHHSMVWSSTVFFAAACWSRTESPLLIVLGCLLAYPLLRRSAGMSLSLGMSLAILTTSGVAFALWHVVFLNGYLPVRPSTADQLVGFELGRFVSVVAETWTNVIARFDYWGVVVWLFIAFSTASLAIYRRVESATLLIWIGAILLGLWLSGTIFSAAVVEQTLRRGMFKVVPLLVLATAASPLVSWISSRISAWELRRSA